MITRFNKFNLNESTNNYNGRYIDLEELSNGNLKISLTTEGYELYENFGGISDDKFMDFFDDIRVNSEWNYIENLSHAGLGMSEAPCITYGYYIDDDGNFTDEESMSYSNIYYYSDYVIKSFTEELIKDGSVIFTGHGVKTKEEIKDIYRKRKIKKYNLHFNDN